MGFLIGFVISAVAGVPSLFLIHKSRGASFPTRLKMWALGMGIRFAAIGGALLILFARTDVARIATVAGVVVAYFVAFALEMMFLYRRSDLP